MTPERNARAKRKLIEIARRIAAERIAADPENREVYEARLGSYERTMDPEIMEVLH